MPEKQLWRWRYTDQWGKRRTTSYHLTEADARQRLLDPEKLEWSLMEISGRPQYTSDFIKR